MEENLCKKMALFIFFLISLMSCKKNEDKTSASETEGSGQLVITENLASPEKLLNIALDSMSSAMDTSIAHEMVSSLALPLSESEGFIENDCTEHAEPQARSGDAEEYKDNSSRLRLEHPRMPLQDFYCKMSKDTGAPDSFLGALSQGKMLFCLAGEGLKFDGEEKIRQLSAEEIRACFPEGLSAEDEAEMMEEIGSEITVSVTSASPPSFGDASEWDGSITLTAELTASVEELKILMKDSDDIVALANLSASGREYPVDGYVVAVNKASGEIRYEAKFQRIRTPDGTSSNGWTRHARAYVKGTFDDRLIFESVDEAQGAYSNIDINTPGNGDSGAESSDAPITSGQLWTIAGSSGEGFKSYSYELSCNHNSDNQTTTCESPNAVSNWEATAGSNACNGLTSGTTCSSFGIEPEADSDTAFIMDLNHTDFEPTEDWFSSLAVPAFERIELKITQ